VSEKSLRSGANFGFSVPAKAQPRTPRYLSLEWMQKRSRTEATGGILVRGREAKDETTSWLLWYHRTRMHSTLNYVSRVKFEQDWMDATVKIAA